MSTGILTIHLSGSKYEIKSVGLFTLRKAIDDAKGGAFVLIRLSSDLYKPKAYKKPALRFALHRGEVKALSKKELGDLSEQLSKAINGEIVSCFSFTTIHEGH
jgi:hypothetical protein